MGNIPLEEVTEGWYWATTPAEQLEIVHVEKWGPSLVVWETGCDFQQGKEHFIFRRRIEIPEDLK